MKVELIGAEVELGVLQLYRAALSKKGKQARCEALEGLTKKLDAERLGALQNSKFANVGLVATSDDFNRTIATEYVENTKKISAFDRALEAFEKPRGKLPLFAAETIAREIWRSVVEGKNVGVFSRRGIIERLTDQARVQGLQGVKDKDVLRRHWKEYKCVAHLGAGLQIGEHHNLDPIASLGVAEEVRYVLSNECPKGTSKPYVEEEEQISFVFRSMH